MSRGGTIFHGIGSVTDRAKKRLLNDHYLKRLPPMSHTFEWHHGQQFGPQAIATFGVPASRHMQKGAWPENPNGVLELNRLWIEDEEPKGTASWFLASRRF